MSSPIGSIADPVAALEALSARLGKTGFNWTLREQQWSIECEFEGIGKQVINSLAPDILNSCLDTYGAGVTVCEFLFGEMRELDCTVRITQQDLDDLSAKMQKDDTLTFRFRLDKHRLLEYWYGQGSHNVIRYLYLFADAFIRFLQLSALSDLEALWTGKPAHKVLVFLPQSPHTCNGSLLAILGKNDVNTWASFVQNMDVDLERIDKVTSIRREFVSWEKPWVDVLTPLHLQMNQFTDSPISRLLSVHWINIILLYTAGRVSGEEKPVVAAYTGSQHAVKVKLMEPVSTSLENIDAEKRAGMHKIWEWVYDPAFAPDRLPFVQIVVAQYLQATGEEFRCDHFVRNAPEILAGLQWHWQAFVEKKIDGYSSQVRALEEYVDETINAYSGQVSELIGSLSETALAAVATILGTFIASLFSGKSSIELFAWGMILYAAYVYVFPFKFKLNSLVEQFKITSEGFDTRCVEFGRYLYKERVAEIVGDRVKTSQERFGKWTKRVRNTYIAIIVLAILASFTAVTLGILRLLFQALF